MKLSWLPNAISILRLLLVIPYSWMFFHNPRSDTLIVALIIIASDVLDGFLARKLHATSTSGVILDTIADTAFIFSSWIFVSRILLFGNLVLSLILLPRVLVFLHILIARARRGSWDIRHTTEDKIAAVLHYGAIILFLTDSIVYHPLTIFLYGGIFFGILYGATTMSLIERSRHRI